MTDATPQKAEIADVICDHAGPCPPRGRGCRWMQFERGYTPCECGGWDERWVSRDKSIRLAGRTNHRRSCVSTSPVKSSEPDQHTATTGGNR